jgi:FtsZ-binding cell division protein ZapB
MAGRKKVLSKHKQIWNKIRKKAPPVPDITCPQIDEVINQLENLQEKGSVLTGRQSRTITKKMERLRTANEKLRESGRYWHDACEDLIDRHIAKKTKPNRWY